MAYANGQLPASALVKISSGHLLRADAAAGFEAMSAAFRARFGYALGVSDGYRPLNGISTPAFSYPHAYSQVGIFENRYPSLVSLGVPDRRGPYKSKYWWRRPGTAAAAVPGTSNHGWGVALDLASNVNRLNSIENLWVRANSTRFGWVWPSWAQKFPTLEPWHYEFVGTVSYPVGGGNGSINIPSIPGAPAPIEEDELSAADVEKILGAINTVAVEARQSAAKVVALETELANVKAGIWYGGSAKIDGVVQKFNYGVLPIAAHNQKLIAQSIGKTAALEEAVRQIAAGSGTPLDTVAIEAAVKRALKGVTFTIETKG